MPSAPGRCEVPDPYVYRGAPAVDVVAMGNASCSARGKFEGIAMPGMSWPAAGVVNAIAVVPIITIERVIEYIQRENLAVHGEEETC